MKKLSLLLLVMLMSVTAALADQYCFFGYGTNTRVGVLTDNAKAKCAIYIPADVAARYKGCYINKVRVGLITKATSLKVFVTKDLNAAAYDVSGSTTTAFAGTTDVQTTANYEIDGEGFYVGYEVESAAPSAAVTNVYNENGCWADLGDGWKNYAADPNVKANALSIDARISGAKVPVDANLILANGSVAAEKAPFAISATVKNQGYSKITKIGLAYSIDGADEKTVEISKLNILAGKDAVCSYTVPENELALGVHDLKMRIVTVNGAEDEVADNNTGENVLNVLTEVPGVRLFVEEQTGINCGFCPRGIVGFKYMAENYPSRFVGVAVHCYDTDGPVAPSDYATFIRNLCGSQGYPGCTVMRQAPTQPSASNLETILKNLDGKVPEMKIEIDAKLSSDNKTVNATAIVTPITRIQGSRYKLGFILTEDDVAGYGQANNFSTGSYGECGGWENKGARVYEPLQHVARATYGYDGIEGSIPADAAINEVINYPVEIEIPSTVKNADKLNAIVVVVDAATGNVVNAAEARVGENSVTSITSADADTVNPAVRIQNGNLVVEGFDGTVKVYTLDGTQVAPAGLAHGIYVVKGEGAGQFVKRIAY